MEQFRHKVFWAGVPLFTLLWAFIVFISFHEWYVVSFGEDTSDYPWGWEGAWYYKTPEVYSNYMMQIGVLQVVGLVVLLSQIFTFKKRRVFYAILGCIGLQIGTVLINTYGWPNL